MGRGTIGSTKLSYPPFVILFPAFQFAAATTHMITIAWTVLFDSLWREYLDSFGNHRFAVESKVTRPTLALTCVPVKYAG